MSIFFYGLITPKGFPLSLLSNFRDYLLFGIIFDNMPIAILCFAIAINIRWLTLFATVGFYYAGIGQDNRAIKLYTIMKQNEK
jgi:hypothetical protein